MIIISTCIEIYVSIWLTVTQYVPQSPVCMVLGYGAKVTHDDVDVILRQAVLLEFLHDSLFTALHNFQGVYYPFT